MQWIPCSMIECSGFHEAWLNAVDSMQHCGMHTEWMQWIRCSWPNGSRLNAVDSMKHDWMHWIRCSVVKCIPSEWSGIHAAWLNAVYSMQYEEMEPYWMRGSLCSMIEGSGFLQNTWMQWILCSMAKSIPIECSGFHAAWLNAVDSNQSGAMYLHWMKRIPCSLV